MNDPRRATHDDNAPSAAAEPTADGPGSDAPDAPDAPDALIIPAEPRPISARAHRRSWAELPVRVWLILMLTILFVTIFFTVTRLNEATSARWVFDHGVSVKAKYIKIGDVPPVPGQGKARDEPLKVIVEFPWNGATFQLEIPRLEPRVGYSARIGSDLVLKVDPADPTKWAEDVPPLPWSQELASVGFLLPLLFLLIIIVVLKRRGVLKIWEQGTLAEAVVVDVRHTAAAPLSRLVRYSLRDGADRRIWPILMPAAEVPGKGETFWVVHAPNNPGKAVVASLYSGGE